MNDTTNDDEMTEVKLSDAEKELLLLVQHGEVFHKLMKFKRFQTFLYMNYDVETVPQEVSQDGVMGNAGVQIRVIERNQSEVALIQQKLLREAQDKIVVANEALLKDNPKIVL